jgi:ankyrin repeat protein
LELGSCYAQLINYGKESCLRAVISAANPFGGARTLVNGYVDFLYKFRHHAGSELFAKTQTVMPIFERQEALSEIATLTRCRLFYTAPPVFRELLEACAHGSKSQVDSLLDSVDTLKLKLEDCLTFYSETPQMISIKNANLEALEAFKLKGLLPEDFHKRASDLVHESYLEAAFLNANPKLEDYLVKCMKELENYFFQKTDEVDAHTEDEQHQFRLYVNHLFYMARRLKTLGIALYYKRPKWIHHIYGNNLDALYDDIFFEVKLNPNGCTLASRPFVDLQKAVAALWLMEQGPSEVKPLLSRIRELEHYRFEGNLSALSLTIAAKNHSTLQLVMDETDDINGFDIRGWGPLHWAILANDLFAVNTLLQHQDIEIDHADRKGFTALAFAVHQHCIPIVERLLESNASQIPNEKGHSPLMIAIVRKNRALVEMLLPYSDLEHKDQEGFNMIELATKSEIPEVVGTLEMFRQSKLDKSALVDCLSPDIDKSHMDSTQALQTSDRGRL